MALSPSSSRSIAPADLLANMPTQDAVADLDLGSPVLLADVIAALATVQARFNALLAELRSANLIAP